MQLVNVDGLTVSDTVRRFEGADQGTSSVSFFVIEGGAPGSGPALHRHPYDETFLVQRGRVRFSGGGETIVAGPGAIAVAPAQTPHKYLLLGPDTSNMVCIHASPRMVTEWLE